jgi:hypothetical protein
MTDARERRRQRHEQETRKHRPGQKLKQWRIPIIIVLLWGAIVAYNVAASEGAFGDPGPDCPGHWHVTFDVFVDGQRVAFVDNPAYRITGEGGTLPLETHMHQGQDRIWHFEPAVPRCIDLGDAAERVDVTWTADSLTLAGAYHESRGWGGTHVDGVNGTLAFWVHDFGGEWREVRGPDLAGRQPPDGQQVLIVFGDASAATLGQLQAAATPIPGNLEPRIATGEFPFVPVMAATIFAALALYLWFAATKKSRSQ